MVICRGQVLQIKKEQANAIQNVRVQGSVKGRNSIGGVIGYYKEQYNASESIFKGAVTQEEQPLKA